MQACQNRLTQNQDGYPKKKNLNIYTVEYLNMSSKIVLTHEIFNRFQTFQKYEFNKENIWW